MDDGMGWWMLFGSIMFVVFWVGVIALAFWFAGTLRDPQSTRNQQPLDIARERYARGEITGEEFERMRQDLRKPA